MPFPFLTLLRLKLEKSLPVMDKIMYKLIIIIIYI